MKRVFKSCLGPQPPPALMLLPRPLCPGHSYGPPGPPALGNITSRWPVRRTEAESPCRRMSLHGLSSPGSLTHHGSGARPVHPPPALLFPVAFPSERGSRTGVLSPVSPPSFPPLYPCYEIHRKSHQPPWQLHRMVARNEIRVVGPKPRKWHRLASSSPAGSCPLGFGSSMSASAFVLVTFLP